jgi:hypothetical protein
MNLKLLDQRRNFDIEINRNKNLQSSDVATNSVRTRYVLTIESDYSKKFGAAVYSLFLKVCIKGWENIDRLKERQISESVVCGYIRFCMLTKSLKAKELIRKIVNKR